MGHPYKKTSPLKVGGLFGLTSKIIPEGAKVIEKAKDLTFDDVAGAAYNVGSLALKGAAGWFTVKSVVKVHPFASVMVTW